ncbi:MAG: YlxR family protein [Kutzneria sp.]|nr:YlxR family protein [Kutzneria sp.]
MVVHRQEPAVHHATGPVRTCVGCRVKTMDSELLRVVVEDGVLVPDAARRRLGRGAWVHPDSHCLRAAERRRAFPKAFRLRGPLDATGVAEYLGRVEERGDSARHEVGRGEYDTGGVTSGG